MKKPAPELEINFKASTTYRVLCDLCERGSYGVVDCGNDEKGLGFDLCTSCVRKIYHALPEEIRKLDRT